MRSGGRVGQAGVDLQETPIIIFRATDPLGIYYFFKDKVVVYYAQVKVTLIGATGMFEI
jgi:hypothetical protein